MPQTAPSSFQFAEPVPVTFGEIVLPAFRARHANAAGTLHVRYSSAGDTSLPVVAVLGGISANRNVVALPDGSPGWWDSQIGAGRGIDTQRFRVLGMDFVTGRQIEGADCDAVDTADQADVLVALLNALRVPRLHTLIGASYGAMTALAFTARYPERLAQLIAISGAHRAHPRATALRAIQRRIIALAARSGDITEGVALARALAIAGYREHAEFAARFSAPPRRIAGAFRFPVEDWLDHNGRKHAEQVHAEDYRQLSESLDLHDVDPADIRTPVTLIAANPDFIVPVEQMRELAARLRGPCSLHVLRTPYGHDAFLKERARLSRLLSAALAEGVPA